MSITGDLLNRFIESNIFFPDPFLVATPTDSGLDFEDILFETDDSVRLHGWMVPAPSQVGLMLFCHGNAGNISHRLDNIVRLNAIGISVFIFDYRGYGRSGGRISEEGFYLDAEAAYRVAKESADREDTRLVIFGRSLGGIAAVHLASANPCSGVILESTFTHLAAMAREHFPLPVPSKLLEQRLNAIDKIGRVTSPIIFFYGDQDEIVPHRLGRELYERARAPKEFVTLYGAGHNDTYLVGGEAYFNKVRDFFTSMS